MDALATVLLHPLMLLTSNQYDICITTSLHTAEQTRTRILLINNLFTKKTVQGNKLLKISSIIYVHYYPCYWDFNPLVLGEFLQQENDHFHGPAQANNLTVLKIWRYSILSITTGTMTSKQALE
jgi:hypothetical protein